MRGLTKIAPWVVFAALGIRAAADTSPMPKTEIEAKIAGLRTSMEEATARVLRMKEAIKSQKDVIKLNCINDRLMQIKAQRNIADRQILELEDASGRNSPDTQQHYADLQSTAKAVEKLREEAQGCAGEVEVSQQSGVDVNHPPLPDDPITDNPFDVVTVDTTSIEPPGFASPYY
jgi:predicted  nucleic acid-binding Zn-ribbon protein